MAHSFFTIGHSTRSVQEFAELLRPHGVRLVVDVRGIPRSRACPQFNADAFPRALSAFGIGYEHVAALGGRRSRQKSVPATLNAFWENRSFHNYADYATTDEFKAGLAQLRELGHATVCAIMCAEAVWWRCHRRIIADYLLTAGERVTHIMGAGHDVPAHMTTGAVIDASGVVTYPGEQPSAKTLQRIDS